jgi:HAD superfamily hydrolase (TIGR01450 family)
VGSLSHIRLFVLDMDGTVYLGDRLFPWTLPFLEAVRAAGADFLFLTNNSSRTSAQYVEKLNAMGIPAAREHVLTSGEAAIELLRAEGRSSRLHVVATPAVRRDFEAHGFVLTDEDPQAVVLTFDTTLTYAGLVRLCRLVRAGLPFIATHPDLNCPTPDGPIPDVGSFLALVEASTGRRPDRIVGKPSPDFLRAAMLRKGVGADQTLMIGDRLYTDIACGLAAGVTTALVLSGESTREMAAESPHPPHLVVATLADLIPLFTR